ncbi:hypothetical protein [Anaerospora sp.]|uniref:hypothetical protein n=1 Tax=Anaerospora sp. TaxID=1960278 RepID=UPI00289CDB63|nr:hypothetical protein [Anaerospora sp.]
MEDRFTRGFTAGIISGLAMNIYSWLAGSMALTTLRMVDWAGLVLYGHRPPFDTTEFIVAQVAQLIYCGALGVFFAYFITWVKSRNIYFKGWLFSTMTWFACYGIATLYKLEGTIPMPVKTVISNFIAAMIFGLAIAALTTVAATDKNTSEAYSNLIAQPAMKPNKEDKETPDD